MRKFSVSVAVIAALFVLVPAAPASAHATFVGAPGAYPGNTDQTLTMSVPHERNDTTYNVAVSVRIPASWRALSCQSKATWTCSIDAVGGREVFRFAKNPGAEVAEDETFQFAVRTAADAGTFPFETVQTYNTGEIVSWIGAAGTANPAPMLTTIAGGTPPPPPTPPTTNPDARPTTTAVVTAPPTSVATTGVPATSVGTTAATTTTSTTLASATTAPSSSTTTIAAGDTDDDDGGGGTTTLGLVALIAIGAGVGLFVSRRYNHSRRRKSV